MRIGFAVPMSGSWATPRNQERIARRAEELGYHSVWTLQRLLNPAGEDPGPYRAVPDPLITLAYLAGRTSRIRLGVAVVNMPFYSPPLLAKAAATLDRVSGGRLDLGLGLGWMPEEFAATGAAMRRRGERAEEFLAVLRALWSEESVAFDGEFHRIPPVRMEPKPVQRPGPPVLLGGTAAPALRRAGRLADGWISSSRADLDTLADQIGIVRAAAEEAGRDPDALRFVCRGAVRVRPAGDADRRRLTGSLDEIADDIAWLAAQGVTELFVDLNFDPEITGAGADPAASMERAEQVLEALRPGR
ncbi:TIGR03619 family F420-dependent LLM class oxidoreductase [Thermomonospora catenispora]|uniref:TIGR03619 family F420-dependent LLM class oxidoreductase n=1 Tax=Thermomonospora catenispora TaxID=2493090 RepID=UPI00111D9FEE|nr:TIGR03619 family F420-dependent LLM class oxidoreductase [Thermomonospora catenispora]TNY37487.1 TIGR03619 family F420-dependent LLM class oxidoreductase [Thermomonospora catenispora]